MNKAYLSLLLYRWKYSYCIVVTWVGASGAGVVAANRLVATWQDCLKCYMLVSWVQGNKTE